MRKLLIPMILIATLCSICITSAAVEINVDPENSFCFSSSDFISSDAEDGIFLTSVPSSNIAKLRYGGRYLQAGDALTVSTLNELVLESDCITEQNVSVDYCTIADGKISGIKTLKLSIHPKKNAPPTASNCNFETYKNIENTGTLRVTDPENSPLTFDLVKAPKRGTVVLHEDGTFTYTPNKNKVGKDSFSFHATDNAGNVSNEATVSINILKPIDKTTYRDMSGDRDEFIAMWLKDNGLYRGVTIAEQFCFSPEATVTRGDFLVMAMKTLGADEKLITTTSGFSDEANIPRWMQPYIATALSNGMIKGTGTHDGYMFRPADAITKAEALVMLQNSLQLPSSKAVFSAHDEVAIPSWAYEAYAAMSAIGINIDFNTNDDELTIREAGKMLYNLDKYINEHNVTSLYWRD